MFLAIGCISGIPPVGMAQSEIILPLDSATGASPVITSPASDRFGASGWKQFWWGKHWRREWKASVAFSLLNLDTIAGGLTPIKLGGGHETKTLRLLGQNGKEYVLRRMDKNVDIIVPEEFKGSFLNDLANDQVSIAHPYGALVAARLAESIGIMHTNPVNVFVSDSTRLGTFAKEFVNTPCFFEERPSGQGWNNTPLTRFSKEVINSEKLFKKLRSSYNISVDQKEFLKIRLFDILINDWDRDFDQWVWTEYKENDKIIYRPFARDRDQAFSRTDGIGLFFLTRPWAVRSLQNLTNRVTDIIGSTYTGRFMDRQFLNMLSRNDWESVIGQLQLLLPDAVILEAVQQLPAPIYHLSGAMIYSRLRKRRDSMYSYGMKYYDVLNKKVTVTGSDKNDVFTITNFDKHALSVLVVAASHRQNPDTLFYRLFLYPQTKEINVMGLGGNDQFIFKGQSGSNFTLRIIDGSGKNQYHDLKTSSKSRYKQPQVYDSCMNTGFHPVAFRYIPTKDTSLLNYNRESFKYDWWMPMFTPAYNPDDGLLTGASFTYKKQLWGKSPYAWEQSIGANYAAATGAYNLFYKGTFTHALGKWDFDLVANYKAPGYVLNFYGYGNNTKLQVKDKSFYRVRAKSLLFNPGVSRILAKNTFKAGLLFNTVQVESSGNKFITQPGSAIDSSVFRNKYFGGVTVSWDLNTADNIKYPSRGINIHAGAIYLDNLLEDNRSQFNVQTSFTIYFSPVNKLIIAHRTGITTNTGNYEFFQASEIGGNDNLRGYWRTRFSGRSSFYQNTDLRWKLADLKGYIIRGNFGLYGFFDDGRVWVSGEHSNTLHTGYGAGIYLIPYNTLSINLSYAISTEVKTITLRTGFLF